MLEIKDHQFYINGKLKTFEEVKSYLKNLKMGDFSQWFDVLWPEYLETKSSETLYLLANRYIIVMTYAEILIKLKYILNERPNSVLRKQN